MSVEQVRSLIDASLAVKLALRDGSAALERLVGLAGMCLKTLRTGGKVIFAGNGGSFADAQHLAAEFVSRFMFDRAPLASIALGTNSSTMSAVGNDYGYEQVFSRELAAVGKHGDVFVAISTSGNSPNVLAAVEVARSLGISTEGLTGLDGGRLKSLCDCICVPSTETARIQECHIMLGHILCGLVEEGYFPEGRRQ